MYSPPSKPERGVFELPFTYLKHPLARPSMVLETLYRRLDTPTYLKGHKIERRFPTRKYLIDSVLRTYMNYVEIEGGSV